jgi:A/G-specific adenine glycosylase
MMGISQMKVPSRSSSLGSRAPAVSLRGRRLGSFRAAVSDWYRSRARPLRIRTTSDPWAVLVSEVMAQQTQIARVDEAWAGFMGRFPTPEALARASTADVLRAWAGLGYNRRALHLQRAAATIVAEYDGVVPSTLPELLALPGVGPYTARAVAAIAHGRRVAAVDTNVRRVVQRVNGVDLASAAAQAEADRWLDPRDPATWTHALMELGATVCLARRPSCEVCPVARWCRSAGRVVPSARQARTVDHQPFERSSRWLRGRILELLRERDERFWTRLPETIGVHGTALIAAAVVAMERDGLLERRHDGSVRLPSGPT